MIVLLAGMPRSGSTFSFNVARELLLKRGSLYQEPHHDVLNVVCRSGRTDHVLIKCHNLDEPSLALARAGAMRIIITVRRVEDAVASWFEAFPAVPEAVAIQIMFDWLTMYRQLRSKALVVPYEQIDRRPLQAVWRIARAICPSARLTEILRISRRLNKAAVMARADALAVNDPNVFDGGFSYYDSATFFHRRHVSRLQSRTAEQRLSEEQLAMIRERLGDAIEAAGLGRAYNQSF